MPSECAGLERRGHVPIALAVSLERGPARPRGTAGLLARHLWSVYEKLKLEPTPIPYAPCMEYLPISTPEMTQNGSYGYKDGDPSMNGTASEDAVALIAEEQKIACVVSKKQ